MSTDDNKPSITAKPIPTVPIRPSQSSIPIIVNVMKSVKTDTPEAKLNETTISDGKGGRITMDDHAKTQTFKGVEPSGSKVLRGIEQSKP